MSVCVWGGGGGEREGSNEVSTSDTSFEERACSPGMKYFPSRIDPIMEKHHPGKEIECLFFPFVTLEEKKTKNKKKWRRIPFAKRQTTKFTSANFQKNVESKLYRVTKVVTKGYLLINAPVDPRSV